MVEEFWAREPLKGRKCRNLKSVQAESERGQKPGSQKGYRERLIELMLTCTSDYTIVSFTAVLLFIFSILCYKFINTSSKATDSSSVFTKMLQTLRPNTMIQEITHDPITPVSTRQLDLQDTSKRVKQPYDVLLVLDVEATCLE